MLGGVLGTTGVVAAAAAAAAFSLATALVRRRRGTPDKASFRIDPFTLAEPWRQPVRSALQAQARFHRVVADTQPGPLRERLTDITARVEGAVTECWQVARRGQALDRALSDVNTLGREQTSIRLRSVVADAQARLLDIDDRLSDAVAQAIEASALAGGGVDRLGSDIDLVADELTALRLALDEVDEIGN